MLIENEQSAIAKLWKEVSPADIEGAPSSVGAFEREEMRSISRILAGNIDFTNPDYYLLGSATATRELYTIEEANRLVGIPLQIGKVTAVDISPTFLAVAGNYLQDLQNGRVLREFETIEGSLDQIQLDASKRGIVVMGLYDLNCLINYGTEVGGEAVGLEEYGEGMRDILGAHTRLLPLEYKDGMFQEGAEILSYKSPTNYEGVRGRLRDYVSDNPTIVGMRVHLSRRGFENSDDPLFVSTWFNMGSIQNTFGELGIKTDVVPTNTRKGSILIARSPEVNGVNKAGTGVLLMNNVMGNLAAGDVMTNFVGRIQNFCGNGGKV